MRVTLSLKPDTESLPSGLKAVLGGGSELVILDRQHNAYSSGSPSEIVTCKIGNGKQLRLLCKYAPHATAHPQHAREQLTAASWSNVPYEAEVYRQVLRPLQLSTARFYGTYKEPLTGRLWLVLQYFDDAKPLDELQEDWQMALAAQWLGRFHASCEQRLSLASLPFLKTHDARYYADCAKQALLYAGDVRHPLAWLADLCRNFESFLSSVWPLRPTITHGDYYRHNILFCEGRIHPVDWEHAAIDLGEMDLACLADGWPDDIQRDCETAYQQARWPQGPPDNFELALNAARLCLYFCEAGILPNWTEHRKGAELRRNLRSLGERLGLI